MCESTVGDIFTETAAATAAAAADGGGGRSGFWRV